MPDPTGYGRILRGADGEVRAIREHKDCSEAERAIHEINPGVYIVRRGSVRAELYPVRNVHQSFEHGLLPGLLYSGVALVTGGWWFRPIPARPGYERMEQLAEYYGDGARPEPETIRADRVLTFDKLTNVHFSGTRHDENQPAHLLVHTEVCHTICGQEYGHPCTKFCPANVYEIVPDPELGGRLQINASNCVHCKTCDIMDPYQVITWVPPEGGGGPQYDGL